MRITLPLRRIPPILIGILAFVILWMGIVIAPGILSGQGHDRPGSVDAALAERAEVAVAIPVGQSGDLRQVTVINAATADRSEVGDPDSFSSLKWSPDGGLIAALASVELESRLHLIDASTGLDSVIKLDPGVVDVSWSPDGSSIAVVGRQVHLMGRDGSAKAEITAPPLKGVSGDAHYSSGYTWSPDGALFATAVNGLLIVIGTDGSTLGAPLHTLLESAGSDNSAILGWSDATTFVVSMPGGAYAIDASGLVLTATPLPAGAALPLPKDTRAPDRATMNAVQELAVGRTVSQAGLSADGGSDVVELRSTSDAGAAPTLVIRDRLSGELFEAKGLPLDLRGGSLYDVYVEPAE